MTETIVPCLAYNRHPGTSQVVKNPPANGGDIRDTGSIPGLGRSPGGGHGNPLQYSCLENPQGQRSLAGYSPGDHRVGRNSVTKHTYIYSDICLRCFLLSST